MGGRLHGQCSLSLVVGSPEGGAAKGRVAPRARTLPDTLEISCDFTPGDPLGNDDGVKARENPSVGRNLLYLVVKAST